MAAESFHAAGAALVNLRIARPVRIQSAGNHHPLLCEMESDAGPAGLWHVKPQHIVSRTTDRAAFGILAELAGAEVCTWSGVGAPAVALTRFPKPVDLAWLDGSCGSMLPEERDEVREIFRLNAGHLAFCCKFLDGAVDLCAAHLSMRRWRATSVAASVGLLVADLYMRHDDRRAGNPNALWLGGRVIAVDHGSAFAGLTRPGTTGDDLARHTVLHTPSFGTHITYSTAATADDEAWEVALSRLENVQAQEVEALCEKWPVELDRDQQSGQRGLRDRLRRFLSERGQHVRVLAGNLRSSAARPT